jgi:hypothetical protein
MRSKVPTGMPDRLATFHADDWVDEAAEAALAAALAEDGDELDDGLLELERHRRWCDARLVYARERGWGILPILREHAEWKRAREGPAAAR